MYQNFTRYSSLLFLLLFTFSYIFQKSYFHVFQAEKYKYFNKKKTKEQIVIRIKNHITKHITTTNHIITRSFHLSMFITTRQDRKAQNYLVLVSTQAIKRFFMTFWSPINYEHYKSKLLFFFKKKKSMSTFYYK